MYSKKKLKKKKNQFKINFKNLNPKKCFAVKAKLNIKLLKESQKLGLGSDVVSLGELMKALKAVVNPKKIVFSGVGKTSEELDFAIQKEIDRNYN